MARVEMDPVDAVAVADERPAPEDAAAPDAAIARLLEHVPEPALQGGVAADVAPALRTARLVAMGEGAIRIAWRGRSAPVAAELDDGVDREVLERAMENGDLVLVEVDPVAGPLVIGVVQRRVPVSTTIRGETVTIEADREILLRSGRAAVRLREDGDVEVVGSRISTVSRGLFRIVGRVLRLN